MNDAAVAGVDAMMTVEPAWRDEMRGERRLIARSKASIEP
jgi:hypothetical protein